MKKDAAKSEILNIWLWQNLDFDKYDTHAGFKLHEWLLQNRKDLLSFRCAGNKRQTITSWVNEWQRHHPKEQD